MDTGQNTNTDKLSSLAPARGATRKRRRIGRGQGSGRGGTSTRGNNGAQARSSYHRKRGFEGGQMPLTRRVPKFGFTRAARVPFVGVNLARLEALHAAGRLSDAVTPALLFELGVVRTRDARIKVLGTGDLKAKLHVTAHGFSASAREKILAAGGDVVVV